MTFNLIKNKKSIIYFSIITIVFIITSFNMKMKDMGVTFAKAYNIAYCEAKKCSEDSGLLYATSADNQILSNNDSGINGVSPTKPTLMG